MSGSLPSLPDFRALFEGGPGLYLVLAPDLTIVAVSDAYAAATMTVRDAILGRNIFDVFPDNPNDPAADGVGNLRSSLMRVLEFGRPDAMAIQKYHIQRPVHEGGGFEERYWSPLNTPILSSDGKVAWIIHRVEDVTSSVRLQEGGPVEGIGKDKLARAQQLVVERLRAANRELSRQIEERERAEAELSRTRRFLDLVIENIPGMVFAKDAKDLKFILLNRAGEKLLGRDRDEIIGKTSYDLVAKDRADAQTLRYRDIIASGQLEVSHKGDIVTRSGERRVVQTKILPVADKDGNPEFVLGLCEDITDRESLEQQLRQAQKMESIGQLTGGVAHDFNNLLGIIMANLDLLMERLDPDEAELAQEALDGAVRGAELTQRMLAFARKQPLQPKTIDLNEALPGVTGMLRRTVRENIAVEMAPAEGLWAAFCDKSQIEDVILNLAINARDAMPDGGRLLIETANVHLDATYAAQHLELKGGDYVMLAVTDSGTGMTPDVIERAFEPFFTTKSTGRGSGLGLSMVYGFAKQSGGHVKLYSEVGHGTTVKLYLPRAAGDAGETSRPDTRIGKALRAAGDETILVVEDDERLRRIAVKLLRELGYAVHEADNAQTAWDILEDGTDADLLFTDVVMPGVMTGVDLAVALRKRRPDLKVLLTTGYSEIFVKNGNGHDDMELISKPYNKRSLALKIRKILDERMTVAERPANALVG